MDYPIIISRLSDEDGGGFMGIVPDLMGCMSDGDTADEALRNTQEAILEWLDAAESRGLDVPEPHSRERARSRERAELLQALKELGDSVDHLDGRLDDLSRRIQEIEDKLENSDAWDRFALISGQSKLDLRDATGMPS